MPLDGALQNYTTTVLGNIGQLAFVAGVALVFILGVYGLLRR
jgi:type IV secretory pathway VirB2 component (pilin)